MSYKTKQKDLILNEIKKRKGEFTPKDIYEILKKETGLTTVYRLIDNLFKDGYLRKRINDNNITYYQYLEKCSKENHFYLKCNICQKLIHIDCDCINDLAFHINKKHNFQIDKQQIIIYGICDKCRG